MSSDLMTVPENKMSSDLKCLENKMSSDLMTKMSSDLMTVPKNNMSDCSK